MAKSRLSQQVNLEDRDTRNLARFTNHRDLWQNIFEVASRCEATSQVSTFCQYVSNESNVDLDIVHRVLVGLCSLRRGQQESGFTVDRVIEDVSGVLEQQVGEFGWTKELIEEWNNAKEELVNLLDSLDDDHPLMVSLKAQHLVYDRPNLLRDIRIITDIRPVFDKAAEHIHEMVVTHNLIIEYEDKEGRKELYLAVDNEDISSIRNACDRADAKSHVILDELRSDTLRVVEFPDSDAEE